jgi:hypothetical protein
MTTITAAGYIVYQSGLAIFGTGATLPEAKRAALEWLSDVTPDDLGDLPLGQRETHGELYYRPATAALISEVDQFGGDLAWGNRDGIACTCDEEA